MRPSNREANQLRSVKLTRNYTKHAEGSVLVEFGQTKVLCNASVTDGVPRFIKGKTKVGLPLNTVCFRVPPTVALNEKQAKENKAVEPWKSSVSLAAH